MTGRRSLRRIVPPQLAVCTARPAHLVYVARRMHLRTNASCACDAIAGAPHWHRGGPRGFLPCTGHVVRPAELPRVSNLVNA